jgi:hypothetical protein
MSDFKNPISSKPSDPYEHIQVENATEKKEEEKNNTTYKTEKKGIFALAVLTCLKKVAKFFTLQERKINLKHNLAGSGRAFKEQLEKLEKENLSEDDPFVEKLSNSWKEFIEAYEYDFLKKEQSDQNIEKLISEVNNYYGNQEFPLGYYLVQYKKVGWHPFPFINILKLLHTEHNEIKSSRVFQHEIIVDKNQKKTSTLENWVILLDKIV